MANTSELKKKVPIKTNSLGDWGDSTLSLFLCIDQYVPCSYLCNVGITMYDSGIYII